MKNLITSLKTSNNNSFYLSFFRVIICLLLIKQVFQIFPLLSLTYKGDEFLTSPSTIVEFIKFNTQILKDNMYAYIYMYLFFIILYLFGIGKNVTAFVVFVMTDILQKLNPYLLNGGDNLLKFLLLYMVFANSFTHFAIHKSKVKKDSISNVFSNLSVLSICIHLCMIYFLSGLHKTNATVWFHGVATYYTFQLERFSGTSLNSVLAQNSYFVVFSTYFTLILELYYPVLVWFKKTRTVVVLCMISLHAGIAIFMMLYDFQFIFILVQGFFYKDIFWLPKYRSLKKKIQNRTLFSLSKNPSVKYENKEVSNSY
ncbi:hypothetical protein [Chryseobacterium fistulae]|uniref:HTTM-like domain-containing protein n=1 Tax=Chryseobacterium fistulae TaxID=2675058 RepID=A0A6N4XJV9_9FLAO|nr:hypothetical protein [Chryseobacterium fistulae]CAA7386118.1 hypothetical protein CHRY9393_00409 [Chryseobacterium fistulae]